MGDRLTELKLPLRDLPGWVEEKEIKDAVASIGRPDEGLLTWFGEDL